MKEKIVGQRVREMRKFHSMSQAQIGEAIGVSKQAISKIETGKTKREENTKISTLAKLFDCHKEYLTGEYDTTGGKSDTGKPLTQPMRKDPFYYPVAHMHEHLEKAEQEHVVQFLNKVIELDKNQRASLKQIMPVIFKLMTANEETVVLVKSMLDMIIKNE